LGASGSRAIDVPPVSDAGDDHQPSVIIDGIDDPVVADTNAIVGATRKLGGAAYWTRISGESVDCTADPFSEPTMQTVVRARRGTMEPDLVVAGLYARYPRTSAQDTASPRSSRACSAARLSSRYSSRSRSSA